MRDFTLQKIHTSDAPVPGGRKAGAGGGGFSRAPVTSPEQVISQERTGTLTTPVPDKMGEGRPYLKILIVIFTREELIPRYS